jgi:hypothetical protein
LDIKLDSVAELMEERGIRGEDISEVVAWGEGEGGKLVDGELNLAKKRLDKVLVYVEYKDDGTVTDVYSHRVTLGKEV